MKNIENIIETKKVYKTLLNKNLIIQYKKSKIKILKWFFSWIDFKQRQPKKDEIYSFRINKQFRAFARFVDNSTLLVYHIDNHQNY